MGGVATIVSMLGALFVGFLQLPGWMIVPLAGLATYGMYVYHPSDFASWTSWGWSFAVALVLLSIFSWLAYLASLYVTGHQFIKSM